MKSVADALRREEREAILALGAAERVALALQLGERDLESFRRASAPPRSRDDAVRELERRRQAGRRASACSASIIECPFSRVAGVLRGAGRSVCRARSSGGRSPPRWTASRCPSRARRTSSC